MVYATYRAWSWRDWATREIASSLDSAESVAIKSGAEKVSETTGSAGGKSKKAAGQGIPVTRVSDLWGFV